MRIPGIYAATMLASNKQGVGVRMWDDIFLYIFLYFLVIVYTYLLRRHSITYCCRQLLKALYCTDNIQTEVAFFCNDLSNVDVQLCHSDPDTAGKIPLERAQPYILHNEIC